MSGTLLRKFRYQFSFMKMICSCSRATGWGIKGCRCYYGLLGSHGYVHHGRWLLWLCWELHLTTHTTETSVAPFAKVKLLETPGTVMLCVHIVTCWK